MNAVLVNKPRHAAGNALNKDQLLAQLLGSAVLLGHVLHHAHLHRHAVARAHALHARTHPAHLAVGTAPAVLHVGAILGPARRLEQRPVLGQDAAHCIFRIQPFLALVPGDFAQARRPQQHGLAGVLDAPPVAGPCQGLHGVEHLGLLAQVAPCLGQRLLARLQGLAQPLGLRHIADGHQHAVARHAPRRDVPGQLQPGAIAQHVAPVQRHAQPRHAAKLVDQRRAGELVKHGAGIGTRLTHPP